MKKSKTLFTYTALISSVLSGMLYANDGVSITGGNTPSLTIEGGTGNIASDNKTWSDNNGKIVWDLSDNMYSITITKTNTNKNNNNFTSQQATNFELAFNKTVSSNKIENWMYKSEYVGGISASKNATSLTMDFQNRGLDLSGTMGLNINFGIDDTSSKNASNASNASSGKQIIVNNLSTLKGNLVIFGGAGQNIFTVNVGEMIGDIGFDNGYIDDDVGSTITITKSLTGSIVTNANLGRKDSNGIASEGNGATINFTNGATMEGQILGRLNGMSSLKQIVTFSGAGVGTTVFTGDIFSYGTGGPLEGIVFDRTAGNHITFKNGDMQGSVISSNSPVTSLTGKKGYNNITFNSGSIQTLTGGILAVDGHQLSDTTQQATNTLNIGGNTTLRIVAGSANTVTDSKQTYSNSSSNSGTSRTSISSDPSKISPTFTLDTGSITAQGYGINEINLNSNATLILNGGEGAIQTKSGTALSNSPSQTTSQAKNQAKNQAKSIVSFTEGKGTIQGLIATSSGTATINVYSGASGTITGSILTTDLSTQTPSSRGVDTATRTGSGSNNILLGFTSPTPLVEANSALPPRVSTLTLQGSTNTINNLTATAEKSTLIVDGSLNANTTTITTITSGENLTLNLNGRGTEKGAVATLIGNGTELTLKALTLGSGSTHNTLDLTSTTTKTTITDQIDVGVGQGVTIKLKGQELELTGGMNTTGGTSTINVTANGASANATLSGGDVTLTNLDLVAGNNGSSNAQLTLKNDNTTISTITANAESDTIAANAIGQGGSSPKLTLDAQGASKAITASTSSISGNGLILELKGDSNSNKATFNINGGSNTIKTLTLSGTAGNILNANAGNTTITDAIEVKDSKTLDLGIGNGNLTLTKNLTAGNGNDGTANINFTGNGTLTSNLSVGSSGTLTSNLATGSSNQGTININVIGGDGTIAGKLNNGSNTSTDSQGININFKGSGSSLSLIDSLASSVQAVAQQASQPNHTINTLKAEGEGNILNLSGQARNSGTIPNRVTFQTLKINDLKADSKSINFIVYANPDANGGSNGARADRIIIEGSNGGGSAVALAEAQNTGTPKIHYLGVVGDPHKIIGKDLYTEGGNNNIALATVKTSSNITLEAVTNISGFSLITYEYQTASTNESGTISGQKSNSDYTTYFLGSAKSLGATEASQEVSASALATNYDLYLANMNSLNKRMGELRDNPHSQGVWARVFNGMQTSSFALETQAVYTTIQAGYDYAFGFEGGNNYVGVALSYANSTTKSKTINELNQTTNTTQTKGIDAVTSNAVEIAVYNSYVQDGASAQSGWGNGLFSDSIVKFSYISSDLTLLDQSNTYNTTNYALTLSQEIGYRFLLGSEGEWNIDPQAEVALGYLNQSNLRQTLSAQNYLDGIQNAIVTLRSRVGASFGYDFKKFTEGKSINAKLYVGAYYVYDYIAGGDVSLTDNFGAKVSLSPLASTGRAVMNVGTNIGVQDNTRIYFDFEKSFGGDITTDYQVNLGVRYSFGESNGYTPISAIKTKIAPLKVSDEKPQEQPSQENTSSEEKTDTNKTEQKAQ